MPVSVTTRAGRSRASISRTSACPFVRAPRALRVATFRPRCLYRQAAAGDCASRRDGVRAVGVLSVHRDNGTAGAVHVATFLVGGLRQTVGLNALARRGRAPASVLSYVVETVSCDSHGARVLWALTVPAAGSAQGRAMVMGLLCIHSCIDVYTVAPARMVTSSSPQTGIPFPCRWQTATQARPLPCDWDLLFAESNGDYTDLDDDAFMTELHAPGLRL